MAIASKNFVFLAMTMEANLYNLSLREPTGSKQSPKLKQPKCKFAKFKEFKNSKKQPNFINFE
ncbi:hypothetical protein, partial [Campylobacter sp. CS_ED2]|uniref:hypothetical protein n=1 Tax=Campylobacter sp. CS_ED2 TaxID=2984141 RepID=UPI0022E9B64A